MSTHGATLDHPRVSNELARAMLASLLDNEELGVALLRSQDWVHVVANAAYERIVGERSVVGRLAGEVLGKRIAPASLLAAVVATGRTSHVAHAFVRSQPERYGHAAFTFLRVQRVERGDDGVLVLVRDVSAEVRARRIADHFISSEGEGPSHGDGASAIRTSVAHARAAFGAVAASLFLLSRDGKSLHGAVLGWDWTRTSFVSDVEQWPNVCSAIVANEPRFFTARDASKVEDVWFERRGLAGVLCAPMSVDGRVVGVLFFDYADATETVVDLAVAKAVADRCATLVERIRIGGFESSKYD